MLLLVLAGLWQWGPSAEWLDAERIAGWARSIAHSRAAVLFVIGAYLVGSALVMPITVLLTATGLIFDTLTGSAYALVASLISAAAGFLVARWLGPENIRRMLGARINRISRRLARHGLLNIVLVRMMPLAPFTVINMAAGVSHIRFTDFMLGTLVGMLPGILAITALADRFYAAITNPKPLNWLIAAGLVFLVGGAAWLLDRHSSLKDD